MSQHTPGPWRNTSDSFIHIVVDMCGNEITLCRDVYNARLIAAAPELLETLQRSLNWLSSYPGGCAEGCYAQARAAIAKATGGES